MMSKIDEILEIVRSNAMRRDDKKTCPIVWILTMIGALVAVAGIAYAVYRYFQGETVEELEEDFDEDFDDDFFEDEDTDSIIIPQQELEGEAAEAEPVAEE